MVRDYQERQEWERLCRSIQEEVIQMGELAPVLPKGLLGAWGNGGKLPPAPFVQEIYLTHFSVAGTWPVSDWQKLVSEMAAGMQLALLREPTNSYDAFAIQVVDGQKRKLGYMPRRMNHIPARLLDAGKLLYVKITDLKLQDMVLEVDLFMRE